MKRILVSGFLILALLLQSFPVQTVAANYQIDAVSKSGQVTTNEQQSDQPVVNTSADTGMVTFIGSSNGAAVDVPGADVSALSADEMSAAALDAYAPEFGVSSPETDLQLQSTDTSTETGNYYRYQQTYHSIPVMAGEIIVNISTEGELVSMSGEASPDLTVSTEPQISADEARSAAQDLMVNRYGADASLLHLSDPQLWIFDERLLMPSTKPAELVYRLEATVDDQPLNVLILVSAVTGGISLQFNQIDTDVTGRTWTQANVNQDDVTPTEVVTAEPEVTETPVPTEVLPTEELPTETPTEVPTLAETPAPTETSEPDVTGQGVIWYVSASGGNDTNDCLTAATPCATIQKAADKAAAGDTIYISIGTYTSTTDSVIIIQKSLNLIGGWDPTFNQRTGYSILDGQNSRRCVFVQYYNNTASTVIISNFEIINGKALPNSTTNLNYKGGGVLVGQKQYVTIRNSSIHNNSAISGAGIFSYLTTNLTLVNTSISFNQSSTSGGGIETYMTNNVLLKNITVANNSAVVNSGGVRFNAGGISFPTLVLQNSVISGNTSKSIPDCYTGGGYTLVSNGYNLIQDSSSCSFTAVEGDVIGKNALIGPVKPNGELLIPPNSLVVDAGSPLVPGSDSLACDSTDQSGVLRPQDGNNDSESRCDIGANEIEYFDYQVIPRISIASGDNQNISLNKKATSNLVVSVKDQNDIPIPGKNVTFTAPANGASGTFGDSLSNVSVVSTDQNGNAITSITSNDIEGQYQVTATISDYDGNVKINLRNYKRLFVSSSGSDENTCYTADSPCELIQTAVNKAHDGDEIYITAGTYTNTADSVVKIQIGLSLVGGWDDTFTNRVGYTVLDGQSVRRGIAIVPTNNAEISVGIKNFEIKNAKSPTGLQVPNSGLGGGILSSTKGSLSIYNSSIHDNNADSGGGIYAYLNSSVEITNTTIGKNTAYYGGGVYENYVKLTNLKNVTIAKNAAIYNGGGLVNGSSAPTLYKIYIQNSAIGDNTSKSGGNDCSSSLMIESRGNNLFQETTNCNFISIESDVVGKSPRVGYLLSTGIFFVPPDSPLVDEGSPLVPGSDPLACEPTDQAGKSRQVDGNNDSLVQCDIGAGEIDYFAYTPLLSMVSIKSGANQFAQINHSYLLPLNLLLQDQNEVAMVNVPVTFTAPENGPSGIFGESGTNSISVITDSNGIAQASNFRANSIIGSFQVHATIEGNVNYADIQETNNDYWYITSAGNDSNSCISPSTPCKSFTHVLPLAQPGDMVLVKGETFTLTGDLGVGIYKSIELRGGWNDDFTSQTGFTILNGDPSQKMFGIFSSANEVMIQRFLVQNSSTAISTRASVKTIIDQCVLQGNGLGVEANGSTLIINTTISKNGPSNNYSSGIVVYKGLLEIVNSTIVNNVAKNLTGGIAVIPDSNPSATIKNSIVFDNYVISDERNNCWGSVTSLGNNILDQDCGSSALPSDFVNIDPFLSAFIGNKYYVPVPGSVAIDGGDCAAFPNYLRTDQIGQSRPVDGNGDGLDKCDIGSIEYHTDGDLPSLIYGNFRDTQILLPNSLSNYPLSVSVMSANGKGVRGVDVTFTAPVSGASGIFSLSGTNKITVTTNNLGVAYAGYFTSNGLLGAYKIHATVDGLSSDASFQILNGAKTSIYTMGNVLDTFIKLPGTFICDNGISSNCTNGLDIDADHALIYAEDSYNYYANHHNRNSIDNKGMEIIETVHYGTNYKNSYWDGSQVVYGENEPTDDTVGHELTHGVTDYTSWLYYYYQSGAINESFSDMWGEFIDQSNGKGNDGEDVKWLLGEDYEVYRSMKNPPDYKQPDKMSSTLYQRGDLVNLDSIPYDNGGVHTNSGINNKAVYLMAHGGIFNGYTINGIGNDKVAEIYYEVQSHLITSGANYDDLYYLVSQACTNVIGKQTGVTPKDCSEVHKALDAVEMNKPVSNDFIKTTSVCPVNTTPNDLFSDDFESITNNWDLSNYSVTDPWITVLGYSGSKRYSLHGTDSNKAGYAATAMNNGVVIPTNKISYLYFDHSFGFEYDADNGGTYRTWDGGVLEYELDGNGKWVDASALYDSGKGYNGTIYAYSNGGNVLAGRKGFVRDSHGFISTRYKLTTSALMGHTVRFRWMTGSDQSVGGLGWFIDNVRIYTCEPATPGISLFTDDFLTQKSWVNNSGGSISRDLSKYWLNWSVQQNKPAYYSIPIYATDDPVQMNFRFKVNNADGDATLWIGLANELDKLSTPIAGNDLAGAFIGIDGSDKIQFLSRNADETYDQITSNDSALHYGGANAWRRGTLNISGKSWMFTLKDDGGNTLGQLSGELTEAQPYFNHLVLMYNGSGGTGSISGALDDIQVFGSPDLTTNSVAGTVVNVAGNPVAGVKMVDTYGHSTLTDANGHYFIGNLHTGKKVITPILAGDSFTPGSISLQPQEVTTGVDFVLNIRVPVLTFLETAHVVAGTDGITLAVNGNYFVQGSVIRWNGRDLPTTYFSSGLLKAPLEAADLASVGTAAVTVFTPTPGGGVSNVITFTIAPAEKFLAPPVLSMPGADGNTTSKTPILTVLPVSGAVKYQIQVSPEETFLHVVADITKITTSFAVPTTAALAYGNSYYWRARSIKADGYESAWSGARKLTVSLLSAPGNGTYTTSLLPKFSWVSVTGAKSYKIQISTSHDFETDKVFERIQPTAGFTLLAPLPGANIYYWRVGVQTVVGGEYLFMPEWKLIVSPTLPAKPVLMNPGNTFLTNNNQPKFSWGLVSGTGNTYQIQISKISSFTTLVQSADLAEGVSEYTVAALQDGVYYWRVRTLNYLGAPSAWATYWKLTVDTIAPNPPVLSAPANNAIYAGTPAFSWQAVAGAKYYQFAYGSTTDCNSAIHTSDEMTLLKYTPPLQAANQDYYWCVRARDGAGNLGAWSAARKITIVPPKTVAPLLTSPGAYSTTSTPVLMWNTVPYGERYWVQVSASSTFLPVLVDEKLDPGVNSFTTTSLADGKYYWRVSAINLNGVAGAWSVARTFTVDTLAPAIPAQVTPADGATVSTKVPKLVVSVVSGTRYQFQVDDDSSFGSPRIDVNVMTNYYTPTSALALTAGTWYWHVRTIDAAGNLSDWSSTRSFIVNVP